MDYNLGFQTLRSHLSVFKGLSEADSGLLPEVMTLEERLEKNQRAERIFGSSENTRNERAQIMYALNQLSLQHCGVSFADLCHGAQPVSRGESSPRREVESAESTPPTPLHRQSRIPFKLQIDRLAGLEFEIRAFQTPMGETCGSTRLPYDPSDLISVLKALETRQYDSDQFDSNETEVLQRLGYLRDLAFVPDLLPRIGVDLFQTLFPEQIGTAFLMALNQARNDRGSVALQLRLDQDAVAFACYPWELLHDRHRHLVSSGAVELTRYITYPEATTTLPVAPPWRLLYIEARPWDLAAIPEDTERLAAWNALQSLTKSGKMILEQLDQPTYDSLMERTAATEFHIIHFDGHGVFGRRCPECNTIHYPHLITCQVCSRSLEDVPPIGYLVFEDTYGKADYVSAEAMENLLWGSEVRLVLLSTCQGSVVRGATVFGGLGPGLVRAGVPAVVAMQFSVPVKTAIDFSKAFYSALARGETVARSVAEGRRLLFRGKAWYIPTLYLRSTGDEGYLFNQP